jgi:hypothetical protein
MDKKPERLAWFVLLAAFFTLVALAAGIPLGVRWYINRAMVARTASVEAIVPTIVVELPGLATNVAVTGRRDHIPQGAAVQTDRSAQGILTLYENPDKGIVLGTVQLYANTRVEIVEMQSPRFSTSEASDRIVLAVRSGTARIAATPSGQFPLHFEVRTPQGTIFLSDSSILVEVGNQQTDVSVRYGSVSVQGGGLIVDVQQGQRTTLRMGQPPTAPVAAIRDLIANGNFAEPLSTGWQMDTERLSEDVQTGAAEIVRSGGRTAVQFLREGREGEHNAVAIVQRIDRDARDFVSLKLRMDVRLIFQSLSGGGTQSSEFPVMVRLDYIDAYGNPQHWVRGFYYQNPDSLPILYYGIRIPQNTWYPYESDNLILELADARPARLVSLRIYASGWNYHSMVAEVGLIAE